jgi:membrane protease YdiL (CAAX protease family)
MSIVADATAPAASLTDALIAVACLAVSVPLLVRLVRRGPLSLPDRLPPGGSAWPLVLALAWGLTVWVMVQAGYLQWRMPALRAATQPAITATQPQTLPATVPVGELAKPKPPTERALDLANLPPPDVAFLSTVPHLAAFVALLAFDLMVYGGSMTGLGMSPRQARTGLAAGAMFSLVFVPLVFGGAIATEFVYQAIGYEHPREHDLLRVLGRSSESWVRLALAAGATVVAPLAEELLFRGHAQTMLRSALARFAGRASRVGRGRGFPLDSLGGAPAAVPERSVSSEFPAWVTWGAIVLASMLFASVHDRWTWPPIFLLSLCLGWAYERTGNLWTSIAVHAAFNAVSTLIFLSGAGSN